MSGAIALLYDRRVSLRIVAASVPDPPGSKSSPMTAIKLVDFSRNLTDTKAGSKSNDFDPDLSA
jgi:hypothetical protein